jgi:hypothetical protein
MSATFIRKVNASDATAGSATTVITVDATGFAAGTALILGVFNRTSAANVITGVTDSKSNTWAVDSTGSSASTGIGVASANLTTALVSGDTITVTWAGNVSGRAIQLLNFSGLVTSSLADVAAAGTAVGTTVNGPAVTTTNADDLIVGFFGTTSSITVSSTTWTTTGTHSTLGGPTSLDSVYIEETSTGTYNPAVTYSAASAGGRQATVSYKVAAGGAPTFVPRIIAYG